MNKQMRLLLNPAGLAAREIALGYLKDAQAAFKKLGDKPEPEVLHAFRVGLRRSRTALRTYRGVLPKTLASKGAKRLGAVAKATNAGRDRDVQMAYLRAKLERRLPQLQRTGVRMLLDELEAPRETPDLLDNEAVAGFEKTYDRLSRRLVESPLEARFDKSGKTTTLAEVTGKLLHDEIDAFRRDLSLIDGVDDQEHCHEARLSVKRIRYILEPIRRGVTGGPAAVRVLKRMQDAFGELNDLHVLEQRIAESMHVASSDWSHEMLRIARSGERLSELTRRNARQHACQALAAVLMLVRRDERRLYARIERNWLGKNLLDTCAPFLDIANQMHPRQETVAPPSTSRVSQQ